MKPSALLLPPITAQRLNPRPRLEIPKRTSCSICKGPFSLPSLYPRTTSDAQSVLSICFVEPSAFLVAPNHCLKTLSPSQGAAATAKDLSACSASIHARPLMLNLFCEAFCSFVAPNHCSKTQSKAKTRDTKEDKLQHLQRTFQPAQSISTHDL